MYLLKSEKTGKGINFPTDLKELNGEVLNNIVSNIKMPPNYCIVALIYKTNLFTLASMSSNNNKDVLLNVVPKIAKIHDEDSKHLNFNIGDKVITDRSSLERGTHLSTNLSISSSYINNFFRQDNDLVKNILQGVYNNNSKATINKTLAKYNTVDVYIVEFKIIPVNDIKSTIAENKDINDPF